jgi:hypothetical protein
MSPLGSTRPAENVQWEILGSLDSLNARFARSINLAGLLCRGSTTARLVFHMVISSSSRGTNTGAADDAALRGLLGTGDTAVGTFQTHPETQDDSVAVLVRWDESTASRYD